jgi:hypothetical protein
LHDFKGIIKPKKKRIKKDVWNWTSW